MFEATGRKNAAMLPVLASHVQAGIINGAGAIMTLGGLLLTFLWLQYLYR